MGDTSLWLVVAIGTIAVAGASCMYLIIVIHRKDKELLALEMEKLKVIQRMSLRQGQASLREQVRDGSGENKASKKDD